MSIPPPPPSSPMPPPVPPPPGASAPRGFWQRHPKFTGMLLALALLLLAALVGLWSNDAALLFPILLVPVGLIGGTLALINRTARPYATGFLLTMGVILVVGGGLCVALLAGLTAGSA